MTNPYAPDETFSQIFSEKMWLQGAMVCSILYGAELLLFAICFKLLVSQIDRRNHRHRVGFLIFIIVLFILATLNQYDTMEFTQLAFIENRNIPGGPSEYEVEMYWIPINRMGVITLVMMNWLMDLLLVWRCFVIFSEFGDVVMRVVIILPCLLFLLSFSLGIVYLVESAQSSPFGPIGYTLAYFSATLSLNVIVTIFIVARLLTWRWTAGRLLGAENLSHYASVSTILVESASLFSAFLILLVVTIAVKSPLAALFISIVNYVQTVASLLIIFRIAVGRGWREGGSHQSVPHPQCDEIRLHGLSGTLFSASKNEPPAVTMTTMTQQIHNQSQRELYV